MSRQRQFHTNGQSVDPIAEQSGKRREYAEYGLEDFLEVKGVLGYADAA